MESVFPKLHHTSPSKRSSHGEDVGRLSTSMENSHTNKQYTEDAQRSMVKKPVSHVEFSKRTQHSTQTVTEYSIALLAECEFPQHTTDPIKIPLQTLKEFLLGVQLARETCNKDSQQRILQEASVNMQRYEDIALAENTSRLNAADFKIAKAASNPTEHKKITGKRISIQKLQDSGTGHSYRSYRTLRYSCSDITTITCRHFREHF